MTQGSVIVELSNFMKHGMYAKTYPEHNGTHCRYGRLPDFRRVPKLETLDKMALIFSEKRVKNLDSEAT